MHEFALHADAVDHHRVAAPREQLLQHRETRAHEAATYRRDDDGSSHPGRNQAVPEIGWLEEAMNDVRLLRGQENVQAARDCEGVLAADHEAAQTGRQKVRIGHVVAQRAQHRLELIRGQAARHLQRLTFSPPLRQRIHQHHHLHARVRIIGNHRSRTCPFAAIVRRATSRKDPVALSCA